jgi:methylthioribose-1-phosphate isomerase
VKVNEQHYHTIWVNENDATQVEVIDQRRLPFVFETVQLKTETDAFDAIRNMTVRGAPLIGVTGAYGIYLALLHFDSKISLKEYLNEKAAFLKTSRPTAVNLAILIDEMVDVLRDCTVKESALKLALEKATELKNREISRSEQIGEYGSELIEAISKKKNGAPVNILTHCNAGWLACIDWGTATAPIYKAFLKGIPVHVWVDETRPRNQGARLTAWELGQVGVPHTIIPDNTGGHLMQHGMVDICIVGSDRTTATGDVANKIGTYLKALAAKDNQIPFYVALPSSTFDFNLSDGIHEIPIEQRGAAEVNEMEGISPEGEVHTVRIMPEGSPVANYGFDVTPARLVTGLITERGICKANRENISSLFQR